MKLADLKKLAEARSRGIWGYTYGEEGSLNRYRDIGITNPSKENHGNTIIERDSGVYPPNFGDAEFIIAFANHAEALLKVCEAAEIMIMSMSDWNISQARLELDRALEELEAI